MQELQEYHGNPDESISIVGITGTNGKTTVSTMTRHLLEEPGRPVGLIGTVRYHLGDREMPSFRTTPEAADLFPMLRNMLVGGCSEAVMEVSSHGIHQSKSFGYADGGSSFSKFDQRPLDYHKNMEAYFVEEEKFLMVKMESFQNLP